MIHYLSALSVTEKLRESMQDSGDDFRFAAIESNLAEYANNCSAWHWHEFVEFAVVLEGTVECCTPGGTLALKPGEGYFINASVLHLNRMAPGCATTRFRVLQFETSLLTSARGVSRRYVAPIENCGALDCLALSPGNPLHAAILAEMGAVFDLCAAEPPAYELDVIGALFRVWRQLYAAAGPMLRAEDGSAMAPSPRLKALLAHVHAHYAEPLGVPDLADALHISQREVYRAFRQGLGVTPALYLLRLRLNHAARMLIETDRTVTEIALSCGFSGPSYFCRAFRDLTGASPRDFRRASRRPQ